MTISPPTKATSNVRLFGIGGSLARWPRIDNAAAPDEMQKPRVPAPTAWKVPSVRVLEVLAVPLHDDFNVGG
jgi:hypothetical protein